MSSQNKFTPALGFHFLTPFYDFLCHLARGGFIRTKILSLANFQQVDRAIDIGCGTGTLATVLKRRHPHVDTTALDCDRRILARARDKATAADLDIGFIEAYSEAIPLADEQIDACISTLFFHHLSRGDKTATLNEIFRILKPGGRLLIADWGKPANFLMQVLSLLVVLFDGIDSTRDNHRGNMSALIQQAGFTSVAIEGNINSPFGTITFTVATKPLPGLQK